MFDPFHYVDRLLQRGFFLVDYRTGERAMSRFMSSLGYQVDKLGNANFHDAIHPSDRPTYDILLARVFEGHEDEFFAEYRVRTPKGGYRWVQTFAIVLEREPDGRVARLFGLDRDIGLRKQSEALLHGRFVDLERRYLMSESLRAAGSVVTSTLDIESTIPVILEQASTLFPFTGARIWAYREGTLELLGQDEETLTDVGGPSTRPMVVRVAVEKTPHVVDNLAPVLGSVAPLAWIGIPLLFQGEARGVMEFWHDETGFFRSEHVWPAMAFADNVAVGLFNARQFRATREASETDALTGLPSRRKWERLGPELFEHALTRGEPLTVFMIDMDRFKQINDRFGHAQGDALLRHFSQTCQTVLRKGDLVCRYGGDEFIALLPQTDPDNARVVASRILELFKASEFSLGDIRPSLSLGMASLDHGVHRTLKELQEAADTALYQVKAQGRDGIAVFQG